VSGLVSALFAEAPFQAPGLRDAHLEHVGREGGEVDGVFLVAVVDGHVAVTGTARTGPARGVDVAVRRFLGIAGDVDAVVLAIAITLVLAVVDGSRTVAFAERVGELVAGLQPFLVDVSLVGDTDGCRLARPWTVPDDLHGAA